MDLLQFVVSAGIVDQIHDCLIVTQQLLCVVRVFYAGSHVRMQSQVCTLVHYGYVVGYLELLLVLHQDGVSLRLGG